MLTYADVYGAYADVCWRSRGKAALQAGVTVCSRMLTYADVYGAYADVCLKSRGKRHYRRV